MAIEKLSEFAKDGQKDTDHLVLTDGFSVSRKPARQWFNWLFNTLTLKINEIIDGKIDGSSIVDNLTTDDATKPVSAKQAKNLQDNKLGKTENAVSADKLKNMRSVSFSGGATGSFDFDGSGNSSCILTLANSGVAANTYGSNLKIPVLTVNAKGLITGVSEQIIPEVMDASTSQKGVVQLATDAETKAGLNNTSAVTPGSIKAYQDEVGRVVSGAGYKITYFDWSRICIIEMTLWENGVVENKTIQDANASDRYQTFTLPITLKKCLSSDIKLTESATTIYWNEAAEWLALVTQDGYRSHSNLTTIFARFRRLSGASSGVDTANAYAKIVGVF